MSSLKRKYDDHDESSIESTASSPPLVKMRSKDKNKEPLFSSSSFSATSSSSSSSSPSSSSVPVQFFVGMMSGPIKTLVLHANLTDTVEHVHRRIETVTGIPAAEQRLIYRGKQLQWDQTLAQSNLQNDSSLQLVGRMRSTHHPQAWQLMDSLLSLIIRLSRGEIPTPSNAAKLVRSRLAEFLSMTPKNTSDQSSGHLQIFLSSSAPAALIMLYLSPREGNRECADMAIRQFVTACRRDLPASVHPHCAPIVLEFCKLLRKATNESNLPESLYALCRSCLGSILSSVSLLPSDGIGFLDVFHFVKETSVRLLGGLDETGPPLVCADVADFAAFLVPVLNAIREKMGMVEPRNDFKGMAPSIGDEVMYIYKMMTLLLVQLEVCLRKVEEWLASKDDVEKNKVFLDVVRIGWCRYLPILKELYNISKCFQGAESAFWAKMTDLKVAVSHLVVTYTKRDSDHTWLLAHKEVLEFESRRHLVLMMLPELKDDYEELHEMLIDRSHMLSESFEYIGRAEAEALKSGLFMEFKHEEATGPGVLREWFYLVCQKIFNPENALFVACPNDRRRFFPNHVSKVHPSGIGLEYFGFAGRVIALALMHKLQVGIVFDRVFFLQLAGKKVSLEDIRDADPCMYNSCKKILELDANVVDSDALGLTFVREVEELGARAMVELCDGGKNMTVNSRNRQDYVDLLIEHRFVESIKEQVQRFAKGFADILSIPSHQQLFFQSLDLQDLDWMLHGSEIAISVEDWKAHTEYSGYKESDQQIKWFWEIVEAMSSEQKKVLLFFWTSLKCLPVEGFRGLASRLYIYKSAESLDRLPSSHTCFYRICFPPYSSATVMQSRLNIITQEHVSCSFGTW